jgi:hypothetical protein
MNYIEFVSRLAEGLNSRQTDADFNSLIPATIDGAEQRIYRDLDLLSTIVRDTSATLTANSRNFTLPSSLGRFVVTESMNVFTPVSTTTNRNQMVPVSREWLDNIWGNEQAPSVPSVPTYYAMISDQQIIVGPAPDAAYTMEVVGTIRPNPMSAANPTTPLSLYLPDLFFASAMTFAVGYQRGVTSPPSEQQQPQVDKWQAQYDKLIASANVEEMRKRYAGPAWTPKQPSTIATPPRA